MAKTKETVSDFGGKGKARQGKFICIAQFIHRITQSALQKQFKSSLYKLHKTISPLNQFRKE